MIIQGSNNPLIVKFDAPVDEIPALVASLWVDSAQYTDPIKVWYKSDMTVDDDTAVLPLTEAETQEIPLGRLVLEIKGEDADGNSIFWDKYRLAVSTRRDKGIDPAGGD